jgi:hypothetical protein
MSSWAGGLHFPAPGTTKLSIDGEAQTTANTFDILNPMGQLW